MIDALACLVVPIAPPARERLTTAWTPGPLPLALPVAGTARSTASRRTDTDARRDYFAGRIGDLLYGAPGDAPGVLRWHRWPEEDEPAAEVQLGEDGDAAWLVLHVPLEERRPLADLAERIASCGPRPPAWWPGPAQDLAPLAGGRVRTLTHVLLGEEAAHAPPPPAGPALAGLPSAEQWLVAAAAGTEAVSLDVSGPHLADGLVHLSSDWRALVLRDGMAFVSRSAPDAPFHASARVYARSIYVDVLLLTQVQQRALTALADATADASRRQVDVHRVIQLEQRLLDLRTRVWWTHLSDRTAVPYDLVRAYRRQHRLDALMEQVVADVGDLSRYVQTRALERQALAAEQRTRVQERVTMAVAALAPPSLVYAGTAVAVDSSWSALGVSTALALVASSAGLLLVRRAWDRAHRRRASPDTGRRAPDPAHRLPAAVRP